MIDIIKANCSIRQLSFQKLEDIMEGFCRGEPKQVPGMETDLRA